MNIKESRKSAGLTQQRMSDIMEIPKRTIEDWEAGRSNPPAYVENLVVAELERIGEKMNEVKYLVMNESLDHGEVRNIDIEMFETLDEANVEAEKVWDHMNGYDKKRSHVYAFDIKRSDLDDFDDWMSFTAGGYMDNRFDSDSIYRVDFGTGAGNFESSDLQDAMQRAEKNMSYTGEDVKIFDWKGNLVVISKWNSTDPDDEEKETMICQFGSEGFYGEWYEI